MLTPSDLEQSRAVPSAGSLPGVCATASVSVRLGQAVDRCSTARALRAEMRSQDRRRIVQSSR